MNYYHTVESIANLTGLSRACINQLILDGEISVTNTKRWKRNRHLFNPRQTAKALEFCKKLKVKPDK